jgi:DNA replicative helicase MCM subunit Mcm2 (Cdc46/Mcm family)
VNDIINLKGANMEDKVPINVSDIRSKHLHKEVAVKGFVFEMNMVQPKIQKAAFKCQQCGAIIYEDVLEEPECCNICQQKSKFGDIVSIKRVLRSSTTMKNRKSSGFDLSADSISRIEQCDRYTCEVTYDDFQSMLK